MARELPPALVAPGLTRRRLCSEGHKAQPWGLYRGLLERGAVHRIGGARRALFVVVGHGEVRGLLVDERFGKDAGRIEGARAAFAPRLMPAGLRPLLGNMLDVDEPDHRRLRGLVSKAFTPATVGALAASIRATAEGLLDAALRREPGGLLLVRDFAEPLPSRVIAELIGVDEADRPRFVRWSRRIVGAAASGGAALRALPAVLALLRFARRLARERRAVPRDDLLSRLVHAEHEGERMSEDEVVAMVFLLLVAGHETTSGLIASSVEALQRHPEQLERLRREPAAIRGAVEELLRFAGPLELATERYALDDLELHGCRIPRGALVLGSLWSANHDPRVFDDPLRLDLQREPVPHVAFGHGAHFCLGAALARLELELALAALLERGTPALRGGARVRWCGGLILRRVAELPIVLR